MKEFEEILNLEPANALALFGQGLVFLTKNEPTGAEQKLRRALELDSTLWQAYACLGIIYDRQKRFTAALDEYDKALAINPSSAAVLNNQGMSYYLIGDYEKSVHSFMAALRIDRENARIYNNLGLAFAGLGRYDEAFGAFKNGRNEAGAYNNVGCIYMIEQKYGKATEALQKAMAASPNFYVKAQENIDRLQVFTERPRAAQEKDP
jgi:Flp pilus assembly protein TadD